MNNLDLVMELSSWGHQIRPEQMGNFSKYLDEMLERERVIMVESDRGLEAIIFFFLTDNADFFTNRPMWSVPEDNSYGPIFFVDKMLCRKWTKSVREAIREQVEAKYPQVEYGFWLRRPTNRHVILKVRRHHGIQA